MPLPQEQAPASEPSEIDERRAAQLLEWQRDDERGRRREFWGTVAAMIASNLVGLLIMAQGFRVTDKELGEIFIMGGILVGQTLILVILVRAWLRQRDG
jgi:hypothetical protein